MVRRARLQPRSTAARSELPPSRTSSRSRSKKTTNESAVMPIATIRPAMPSQRQREALVLAEHDHRQVGEQPGDHQAAHRDDAPGPGSTAAGRCTTSSRPSAAAIRPAASWSRPSCGEIDCDRLLAEGQRQRAVGQLVGQVGGIVLAEVADDLAPSRR